MNLTVSFKLNDFLLQPLVLRLLRRKKTMIQKQTKTLLPNHRKTSHVATLTQTSKQRKLVIWKPTLKTWLLPLTKVA